MNAGKSLDARESVGAHQPYNPSRARSATAMRPARRTSTPWAVLGHWMSAFHGTASRFKQPAMSSRSPSALRTTPEWMSARSASSWALCPSTAGSTDRTLPAER